MDGRLIIHRVPLDRAAAANMGPRRARGHCAFKDRCCRSQAFTWQAARLAESLIDSEAIDIIEAQDTKRRCTFCCFAARWA